MHRVCLLVALLLLSACGSTTIGNPPAASGAAKPIDYMGALRDAEAQLADTPAQDESPDSFSFSFSKRSAALQQLGVARSWIGDTAGAAEAFDQNFGSGDVSPDRQASEAAQARDVLARHVVVNALDAIVHEARNRQIVIINEAHHVARHRAFSMELARELRKLGFEYLAMETLFADVSGLAQRRYPVERDGHYSREPVFGDFIRQSLALGYEPIAYEQAYDPAAPRPSDPFDAIVAREEAQAQNIVDRIFKERPKARVLIHVGYSHLAKEPAGFPGGRKALWMAGRLREKTGVDPLCVSQTEQGISLYRAIASAAFENRNETSIALRNPARGDRFWPEAPGLEMQVVHRPETLVNGRPDWLAMHGYRRPRPIPAKLLPATGRRLVQAFVAGETADAVPIDQVIVTAGAELPVLMLPLGNFRFAFQE